MSARDIQYFRANRRIPISLRGIYDPVVWHMYPMCVHPQWFREDLNLTARSHSYWLRLHSFLSLDDVFQSVQKLRSALIVILNSRAAGFAGSDCDLLYFVPRNFARITDVYDRLMIANNNQSVLSSVINQRQITKLGVFFIFLLNRKLVELYLMPFHINFKITAEKIDLLKIYIHEMRETFLL